MNKKRLISKWLLTVILLNLFTGCAKKQTQQRSENAWEPVDSMHLQYATQFAVDYYAGGYKLLTMADGSRFLLIPEGQEEPEGITKDIVPLYQPLENLYLAASAAMCFFDRLDCIDTISLSGIRQEGWYIENAYKAMEEGNLTYAGKYSEPDYEMILDTGCPLAIESLMITHTPEVKEKLQQLGIPVLVDLASEEPHPLGRTEWVKFYGALLDREEEAQAAFQEQSAYLEELNGLDSTCKTVAFFHISSSGYVVVRKPGDYVSKMIELAGGNYVFENLGSENALSTINIEMETFFATAKDADIIIYNSAIVGEVDSLDDLVEQNPLLAQFKAVRSGDVWCTSQNMYQQTMDLGRMVHSFHQIFSGNADEKDEVPYLKRLK